MALIKNLIFLSQLLSRNPTQRQTQHHSKACSAIISSSLCTYPDNDAQRFRENHLGHVGLAGFGLRLQWL
jgi:hypothetical protein